ncbi:MAG: hypothetical protein KJ725_09335 [Gammaproteobacteria bacterium]|uniref:hypothetical protein n=1 Tax=Methylotuvimicrobium sp. TaxID=2822413 RepID=UPI001E054FA6|nr:hypothetical protein [Gammaproteobacteria bacterium]
MDLINATRMQAAYTQGLQVDGRELSRKLLNVAVMLIVLNGNYTKVLSLGNHLAGTT